jgi:hypothetical protein
MGELAEEPEDTFTHEELREHRVFSRLLQMIPGLEDRLMEGSNENVIHVAELIQKGLSSARSDDTKSLKGVVVDWITPSGGSLNPPLSRNAKIDRGFHHERTGALLCPVDLDWSNAETKDKLRNGEIIVSGDRWPIFLYRNYSYDPSNPWDGLLQSTLLVSASSNQLLCTLGRADHRYRHSSISSHRRVLSTPVPKPRDLEMRASTG